MIELIVVYFQYNYYYCEGIQCIANASIRHLVVNDHVLV